MTENTSMRRGLNLAAAICNMTIAFSFGVSSLPVFYPVFSRNFGWSHAEISAGGSIVLLIIGIASPLIGWLVDRYAAKTVLLVGMCTVSLALASLASLASTRNLWEYLGFCILLGFGTCAVSIVPNSILVASDFSRRRGIAVGVINAGIGLGGIIAPLLASSQISRHGVAKTFLFLSACIAVPFLLTCLLARNPVRLATTFREPTLKKVPAVSALVRMPMFWMFGGGLFFTVHAMIAVQQHLVLFLVGQGFSARRSALALSTLLGASAAGKILGGAVADRFSARLTMLLSILCVGLGLAYLIVMGVGSNTVFPCAAVFGLGYGGIFSSPPLIVFEYFGTERVGGVLGAFIVFFGLGSGTGGLLAGYIFDRTHGYGVPFGVDLGFACAALILLLAGRRHARLAAEPTTA